MSYTYRLHKGQKNKDVSRYTIEELQAMGTFMLHDICARERIMTYSAGIDPKRLSREELIRLLYRYRGKQEERLKDIFDGESALLLEALIKKAAVAPEKLELPYRLELKKDIPLLPEEGIRISHGFGGGYFLGILTDNRGKAQALFEIYEDRLTLSPRRMSKELQPGQYRDYELFLLDSGSSQGAVRVYNGQAADPAVERGMTAVKARLPVLSIVEAEEAEESLVIDFGGTNTSAAVQEQGRIRRVAFQGGSFLCPSHAAVESCCCGTVNFLFGKEALSFIRRDGYENHISFFHNLKMYLYEDKQLAVCDYEENGAVISSDVMLRQFLEYIIACARAGHGKNYKKLKFLLPEKRGSFALKRLRILLPGYQIEPAQSESVNCIYEKLAADLSGKGTAGFSASRELAFHCGGASSSLVACLYSIEDTGVSYRATLKEQYIDGDGSFGGNNLTYLILMYLKVRAAAEIKGTGGQILDAGFEDAYSLVDQNGGAGEVYQAFCQLYEEAEAIIPTRFGTLDENRLVKRQNFFRLWFLAENLKIAFFSGKPISLLRLPEGFEEFSAVSVVSPKGIDTYRLQFDIHKEEIERLLAPQIYQLVKRFIEPLCDGDGILTGYGIRFTGLSCSIPVFKDALREFTVGRRVRNKNGRPLDLKLRALDGVILREQLKKSGRLVPEILEEAAGGSCLVMTESYEGGMVQILSEERAGEPFFGYVRRPATAREIEFIVCDRLGNPIGSRFIHLDIGHFQEISYNQLFEAYPVFKDAQGSFDSIEKEEIRLFVFREENWDFCVLPAARIGGNLCVCGASRFLFDNECLDYFSGDK